MYMGEQDNMLMWEDNRGAEVKITGGGEPSEILNK